ncbi:hypothetical protein R1sor_017561 [Riccia sorocarpa]|uniref:Uncharacterized protein n=1 Tax=Riccia sorocarpa TaxID=122646 RepID=A0ABD3IAI9_9MARC
MAAALMAKYQLGVNTPNVPSPLSVGLHETYKKMHAEGVPVPPFREPKIYQSIVDLIGWTPLVEINQITKEEVSWPESSPSWRVSTQVPQLRTE